MEKRRGMNRTPAHKRPSIHTHVARRRVPAAAVLAVAVVLALAGFAAARYVMQQQQDGLATATDFYFTSDYLKESGENATYFIDPGTESFAVELRNYADDLRTTSGDISYKVETTYATATDAGAGKLVGSAQSTAKVTVTPNSEVQEFAVTATSTSPYAQTLTATFILAKGNHYTVEDASGNTAAVLTMTCADSGGSITLNLPSEVIPDATDGRVSENTFTPVGSGVYSLVLLKADASLDLAGSGNFADTIDLNKSPAT